jgi:hypothetical protein
MNLPRGLSYANVMATFAVFIALGAGAYAATQINGSALKNRSVAGNKLKKHTVSATETKPIAMKSMFSGLENGWQQGGGGFASPAYGKDASGIVHLQGLVTNASNTSAAIFTLPSAYRPDGEIEIPVRVGFGGPIGEVDIIGGTGAVQLEQPTGEVHLDGVSFPAGG